MAREELAGPEIKGRARRIVETWADIAPGRAGDRLSWADLSHYRENTGRVLRPDMARAVIAVDRAYLAEAQKIRG